MPIVVTGTVTPEEVDAILTPELIPTLTGALTKKEYFVVDKAGKTAYETNLANNTKSSLTLEHATALEKDVFELTGIEKLPGEKYYDYNKRALGLLKSKEAELTTLKGKTDLSAAERARIVELETLATTNKKGWDDEKTGRQSDIDRLKAENQIYSQIGKVKMKKDEMLQDAIQIVSENTVAGMIKSARKHESGKYIFMKEDGTAYTNADASFMTAEQVYALKMDKFVDKGVVKTGAGGGEGGNPDLVVVGQFTNQVELNRHLSKQGLVSGTKEFSKEFTRLGGNKLPMR